MSDRQLIVPPPPSTMRTVPFLLLTTDWLTVTNGYSAEFLTEFITATSREIVIFDENLQNASTNLTINKNSTNNGLKFDTEELPVGSISGTIYITDRNDGRVAVILQDTVIPINRGGTGANSAALARGNLSVPSISDINGQRKFFTNITVETVDWDTDTTYTQYPYRAALNTPGVTANHYCEVIFDVPEATSGYFAPVCQSAPGTVYIYASAQPSYDFVIPTIKCTKTTDLT